MALVWHNDVMLYYLNPLVYFYQKFSTCHFDSVNLSSLQLISCWEQYMFEFSHLETILLNHLPALCYSLSLILRRLAWSFVMQVCATISPYECVSIAQCTEWYSIFIRISPSCCEGSNWAHVQWCTNARRCAFSTQNGAGRIWSSNKTDTRDISRWLTTLGRSVTKPFQGSFKAICSSDFRIDTYGYRGPQK